MQITRVRVSRLEGILDHSDPFWDDSADSAYPLPLRPGQYHIEGVFVEVETDEGVTGLGGPIDDEQGLLIAHRFTPRLLGADPCATELLWDRLYRLQNRASDRPTMSAMSAVDYALWDVKAKWLQLPVYRLLGGPTRTAIPAYVSADGYSLRPELVRQRAAEFVAQGYRAMKWFFRYSDDTSRRTGFEAMQEDLALAQTLRESVGDDIEIMLDAVQCWSFPYTLAMLERLAEHRPAWLEDPMPTALEDYVLVRKRSPIPIAAGYDRYSRWQLKQFLDAHAVDILQPDFAWIGGISEALKVCAVASTYDVRVVPHGAGPATAHVLAAQPADLCPMLEYAPKWQLIDQFFYREPLVPEHGVIRLSERPGLGVELDEDKIRMRHELA